MRPRIRSASVTPGVAWLLIGVMAGPMAPNAMARPMKTVTAAEQSADPWETLLPAVPVGTRLLLTLTTGAQVEGRLVTVLPDAVVLDDNRLRSGTFTARTPLRESLTFRRADVRAVSVADTPPRPAAARNQEMDSWEFDLPAASAGSQLLLTLASGGRLECRLIEAMPDAVVVNDCRVREGQVAGKGTDRDARTFSRRDVTRVAMVDPPRKFASNGQPNAAVVRFLVTSWGVGKKVDVQTITAERIRARIASIEPGGFTVVNKMTAHRIDYAGVHHLRQDSSKGKNIWITVGVAAGVLLLLMSTADACSTYSFSC